MKKEDFENGLYHIRVDWIESLYSYVFDGPCLELTLKIIDGPLYGKTFTIEVPKND